MLLARAHVDERPRPGSIKSHSTNLIVLDRTGRTRAPAPPPPPAPPLAPEAEHVIAHLEAGFDEVLANAGWRDVLGAPLRPPTNDRLRGLVGGVDDP